MGIVAKQSIINTLITYAGFAFGAANTLFLFTNILGEAEYGVVSYLLASSNLLWPLLAFGLPNTLIKFYNQYNSKSNSDNFFSWLLLVPLVLVVFVSLLYTLFYEHLMEKFTQTNPIVIPYLWMVIFLGLTSAYFELFYAWVKVHLQTVKGNLIKEFFSRVCITLLLILVYFNDITPDQFIYSLTMVFLIRTLLMIWIAFGVSKPKFSFQKLANVRSVVLYSCLILISATVSVFLLDLDKVMIERLAPPISNVAKYSICVYIASVIGVPIRAMLQITNPLTAQLLAKKDIKALYQLNKKSSLTALIATLWVGLVVVCNVHSIFEMVPSNYQLYIEIVFLIGFVKLFDASLGVTNAILFNSDSYKWILFFGIAILVLAYIFNTFFIPTEGIIGAAFATFLAYTLYNVAKLLFVFYNYKIQPYSKQLLVVMGVAVLIWIIFYFWYIPRVHAIVSIGIKGSLITLVYFIIIYMFRLSPEVNSAINSIIKRKK
ncbi:lipopolysaccharide biosynthesis protein [Aquimarina agarivorans]|uniref:lipopolysaccharide biosynthesis protein n=1 Tax=Aquimarina agarivorans TaxID=980584 RepID=UPI000248F011|nr:oligosaccharide flippase family protein [Aquimarina agarivorans]